MSLSLNPNAVEFIPSWVSPLNTSNGGPARKPRKRGPQKSKINKHQDARPPMAAGAAVATEHTDSSPSDNPYLMALKKLSAPTRAAPTAAAAAAAAAPALPLPLPVPAVPMPLLITRPSEAAMEHYRASRWQSALPQAPSSSSAAAAAAAAAVVEASKPSSNTLADAWHKILTSSQPHYAHDTMLSTKPAVQCEQPVATAEQWWTAVWACDHPTIQRYMKAGINWDMRWTASPLFPDIPDCCVGLCALHLFCHDHLLPLPNRTLCLYSMLAFPAVTRNIDLPDRTAKRTALHYAAVTGQQECVRLLVDHGEGRWDDAGTKDRNHDTALHLAALYGHTDIVAMLLERSCRAGLRVNQRNRQGQHALMIAANRRIAQLLLEAGADLSICDNDTWDTLCHVSKKGDAGILRVLLTCNTASSALLAEPRPNMPTTALHQAAIYGLSKCISLLLRYGFAERIDSIDHPLEYTALMHAAMAGHVDAFLLLLDAGASADYIAPDGMSAMTIAATQKHVHFLYLAALQARARTNSSGGSFCSALNDRGHNPLGALIHQQSRQLTISKGARSKEQMIAEHMPVYAALILGGAVLCRKALSFLTSARTMAIVEDLGMVEDTFASPAVDACGVSDLFPHLRCTPKQHLVTLPAERYKDLQIVLQDEEQLCGHLFMFANCPLIVQLAHEADGAGVKEVHLPSISLKVMQWIFIHIYSGQDVAEYLSSIEDTIELLQAANKLGLRKLQAIAEMHCYILARQAQLRASTRVGRGKLEDHWPLLDQLQESLDCHVLVRLRSMAIAFGDCSIYSKESSEYMAATRIHCKRLHLPSMGEVKEGLHRYVPVLLERLSELVEDPMRITAGYGGQGQELLATLHSYTCTCYQHTCAWGGPWSNTRLERSYAEICAGQPMQFCFEYVDSSGKEGMYSILCRRCCSFLDRLALFRASEHYDIILTNAMDAVDAATVLGTHNDRLSEGLVFAHRALVLEACPKLAAMVSFRASQQGIHADDKQPMVLRLQDISTTALAIFVQYIYTGALLFPVEQCDCMTMSLELSRIGHEYLMLDLQEQACLMAISALDRNNAAVALQHAQQYEFTGLQVAATMYILQLIAAIKGSFAEVIALEACETDEEQEQKTLDIIASLLDSLREVVET